MVAGNSINNWESVDKNKIKSELKSLICTASELSDSDCEVEQIDDVSEAIVTAIRSRAISSALPMSEFFGLMQTLMSCHQSLSAKKEEIVNATPRGPLSADEISAQLARIHEAARTGDIEHLTQHLQEITDLMDDIHGIANDENYAFVDHNKMIDEIYREFSAHIRHQVRLLETTEHIVHANKLQLFARRIVPKSLILPRLHHTIFGRVEEVKRFDENRGHELFKKLTQLKAHIQASAEAMINSKKRGRTNVDISITMLNDLIQVDEEKQPHKVSVTLNNSIEQLAEKLTPATVATEIETPTHPADDCNAVELAIAVPDESMSASDIQSLLANIQEAARTGDLEHINTHLQQITVLMDKIYDPNNDAHSEQYEMIYQSYRHFAAHIRHQIKQLEKRESVTNANPAQKLMKRLVPKKLIPTSLREQVFGTKTVVEGFDDKTGRELLAKLIKLKAHIEVNADAEEAYRRSRYPTAFNPRDSATKLDRLISVDAESEPWAVQMTLNHTISELEGRLTPAVQTPLDESVCYGDVLTKPKVSADTAHQSIPVEAFDIDAAPVLSQKL